MQAGKKACSPPDIRSKKHAIAQLFFTVDTCVLRCYKTLKDKLFGGESPNELPRAVRE
jgi:hypothetical protein